ncbi:hypothetical protein Vc3S01_3093 [Vibrio campbellii]|nr:hypothetical protein Vc3S01_3093 [Vibrio campbellii]EDL68858.1 hypothetical protein A1Q_0403 [Vibrio campbellii HY01]
MEFTCNAGSVIGGRNYWELKKCMSVLDAGTSDESGDD